MGSQIIWPLLAKRPLFYPAQSPLIIEKKEIIIRENQALIKAIGKVEKTIVGVRTVTKTGKVIEGSGLILTSDGLMVTLADLVPRGANFAFNWQGKLLDFQILKRDFTNNLALIKLKEDNLPTVSFASDFPKLGEPVFLVGIIFPKVTPAIIKKTVNSGIVRNFNKEKIETNILETDLLKGSSLFDIEGRILGLNMVNKKGNIIAIPTKIIKEFTGL
jgi:hypothetical protein